MENQNSLIDYLNNSREQRRKIISIANDFFEKAIKEEEKIDRSKRFVKSRENSYTVRTKGIILEPIKERASNSRTLLTKNKTDILL